MLKAWRIVKEKHASTAFSGEGARLFGGRWNGRGTPVIYAAESQSLAVLEMLVHLVWPELLKQYVLLEIVFDEELVSSLERSALPRDWRGDPAPAEVRLIGDAWAGKLESAVLKVPSVLVPDESNYLFHPQHAEFRRIRIGSPVSFQFDTRLTRQR
jgi:RES domain-containing protein